MTKRTGTIARHGDILLRKTSRLVGKKVETKTLALGEVTGHHHTFEGDVVCYADDLNEVKTVEVLSVSPITHQEHGKIKFDEGKYQVYRKTEYDPFTQVIRQVRD